MLTTADGVPYLAPEVQLLFKSKDVRPKDDLDAATVVPELEPERRTWLAQRLPAEHAWQTTIASERARSAIEITTGSEYDVAPVAAGRSSQAWRTVDSGQRLVVRVPISNSGRLISYRSEARIGELLADAGHPVTSGRRRLRNGPGSVRTRVDSRRRGRLLQVGQDAR